MSARRPADNPFRSERVLSLRYRADLEALLRDFAALAWRAALVGPHGSGKSTLREDLLRRLRDAGWQTRSIELHANESQPDRAVWDELIAFQRGGERRLVAIDGAELIARWRWPLLARRLRGPLLITSTRGGRLPTLHRHRVEAALLHALVGELVGPDRAARLRARCDELFARHHGNLRDCLRSLYDEWQGI